MRLPEEESGHCVRVLRHRRGEQISVIDGEGTMYTCTIMDNNPKKVAAQIIQAHENWGGHPYKLTMAVCPTKNSDRYEWFAEKACEIGVDEIVPVIGEHSERRVFKGARIEKILVSAAKQSLKGAIPALAEPIGVKDYIKKVSTEPGLKLIAYCFEDETHPRRSIKDVISDSGCGSFLILIGPEGDFSKEEAALALESGFIPVHLGDSRLRTETAALTAVASVYYSFL